MISDAWGTGMEAAPRTSSDFDDRAWALIASTIKGAWATRAKVAGSEIASKEIVVAPGFSTGVSHSSLVPILRDAENLLCRQNTDTRYYWSLTRQIFRYNHKTSADGYTPTGVHSVNEALKASSFVEASRWFALLILNADKANL